jgi:hypothetical protein
MEHLTVLDVRQTAARGRYRWVAPAAVLAAVFAFRFLSYTGFPNDHFVYLARAQQMLLGAWPVRDFVDPGFLLMYLASAAGLTVFGHNLLGEALIVFGAFAAAAAVSYRLSRAAAGSAMVAVFAVALQALAYPRSYSYPKLILHALAIALCWKYLAQPTPARRIGLAGLVAISSLFRPDHGVVIGLAALFAVVWADVRPAPARARAALRFAAATAAFLLPWIVFVQSTAGLTAYARSATEFVGTKAEVGRMRWPSFRIDVSEGLWTPRPVPAPEPAVIHVRWKPDVTDAGRTEHERNLGLTMIEHHEGRTWRYHAERNPDRARAIVSDPAVEDTAGLERLRVGVFERAMMRIAPLRGGIGPGLPIEQNSEAFLYHTFLLLPVAGAVVLFRRGAAAAPMSHASGRLLVVIIVAVCVNATLLRDPLRNRLADVAVPQTILAAWLFPAAWRALRGSRLPVRIALRTAVATAVCMLTLSVVVWLGQTREQFDRIGPLRPGALADRAAAVTRALRDIPASLGVPSAEPLAPAPLIAYLQECTEPDDRFSYFGYAPETYFFAGRGFAGGQLVFFGSYYTSPEEQDLMLSRLRREQVPVIALPDRDAAEFRRTFSAIAAYVDANYVRVGNIDLLGDRRGDVLLDRRRTSVGVYAPLGWPCFARAD